MPRARFLGGIGGLVAAAGLLAAGAFAATPVKPNVLFIAVDDLNHWVGYLGRNPQTKTPNIDRLAKMGVAFSNAYCAVPACEPARAALMGGRRPWSTGLYYNGDKWKTILPEGQGLTMPFMKASYRLSGAGKNHAVRTEQWRYIRCADGGEELYDEKNDPYEWTNLAGKPEFAATKAELAKWLPTHDAPHKGRGKADEGDDPQPAAKKKKKKTA